MEKDRIDDSSFVVITGPPQKDKSKRISHVRSMIRKSQLRRDGQLQARTIVRNKSQEVHVNGLGSPSRELTWKMDLPWLTVSETVTKRLRYFFRQYIESSAHLHPFFRAMIPITVLHLPLMSTKLVNATAWDDLNGPTPEISALTLFQREIAESMLLDSIKEVTGPNANGANIDVALISSLSLLSFEIMNGDEVRYLRHKRNIHRLLDLRGGIDGIDVNLKISILVIYQLEPVIKGFAGSVSPSLDYNSENETLIMSQPTDFKLMTFQRGQTQFREGKISLSTTRLLSDFFQLVTLSIQYQQLSNYHQNQNGNLQRLPQIRIQWHFLRDNLIALNSIPFRVETDTPIDRILLCAISLFVSPSFSTGRPVIKEYIIKLQSLLQRSNVLHLYHCPLPGALIWCLIIGARKSDEVSSRQPGDPLTSVSSTRKWFVMQVLRILCPAALDDSLDVSRNIDLILAGMDGVDCLSAEPPPYL